MLGTRDCLGTFDGWFGCASGGGEFNIRTFDEECYAILKCSTRNSRISSVSSKD